MKSDSRHAAAGWRYQRRKSDPATACEKVTATSAIGKILQMNFISDATLIPGITSRPVLFANRGPAPCRQTE